MSNKAKSKAKKPAARAKGQPVDPVDVPLNANVVAALQQLGKILGGLHGLESGVAEDIAQYRRLVETL